MKVRQGVYGSSLKANMAVDAAALNMLMEKWTKASEGNKGKKIWWIWHQDDLGCEDQYSLYPATPSLLRFSCTSRSFWIHVKSVPTGVGGGPHARMPYESPAAVGDHH